MCYLPYFPMNNQFRIMTLLLIFSPHNLTSTKHPIIAKIWMVNIFARQKKDLLWFLEREKESLKAVLFLPTPAVKCREQRQILWNWRWQSMSLPSAVSLMSDLICSNLCKSWILWSFGEFMETKGFSYEQTEQDLIKELWIN